MLYRGLLPLMMMALSTAALLQSKFIPLNVDYAVFNTDGSQEYVEIYFSIPQKSLTYQQQDSIWSADFMADITIFSGEKRVFQRRQPFFNRRPSVENINAYNELRHVFATQLAPGDYRAVLLLSDNNAGVSGEYQLDFKVVSQSNSELSLSDIELAAKISPAGEKGPFNKNGMQVVPNPSGVYHIGMPMLYYYAEAHHVTYTEANPGTYMLAAEVLDLDGNVIRTLPTQKRTKPGNSVALIGGGNIVTLSSAPHVLRLRFTDEQSGKQVEQTKRFTMFKPDPAQLAQVKSATTRLMQSYYERFSEETLDEEFAKTRYISAKEEISVYGGLEGVPAKAEFLAQYWRSRDPDPTTPENAFKIDYFQRVELAAQQFKTKFREGWNTDRGRVFLTYGQPNDIERSPMQSATRPYEIWSYNELEDGSIFVFADVQGFGDYELLHSTYRKEVYQLDWERRVRIIRDNTTNTIIPDDFR